MANLQTPLFADEDVPVCTQCLRPHSPLLHICPHCGNTVGQFTPNIPFVSIPFEVSFFAGAWRAMWADDTRPFKRVCCVLAILMFAPILLVGLPFILFQHARRKPRGFDVLVEAERKIGAGETPAPPPAPKPLSFDDRPRKRP